MFEQGFKLFQELCKCTICRFAMDNVYFSEAFGKLFGEILASGGIKCLLSLTKRTDIEIKNRLHSLV